MSNQNLSNQIMQKIQKEQVKIRSKWFFIAQKLGLESSLALLIICGVIILNAILYIMQKNNAFEFISFGIPGWQVVLNNIPFDLIIILILLIIVANITYKKFDISYHKPFYYFTIILIAVIGFIGTLLAYSGINEEIVEENIQTQEQTLLNTRTKNSMQYSIKKTIPKRIYNKRVVFHPIGNRAVIGTIVECSDNNVVILTTNAEIVTLKLDDLKYDCQINQIVKSIGLRNNNIFKPQVIQTLK